jgi:hypothetical protein
MKTGEQNESQATPMEEIKEPFKGSQEAVLPSGKVAVVSDFKGKHIRQATEMADGNAGKMIFALIAITTTIDGKKIVLEDIDEMPGRDVLKLQAMFSVNF